MKRFIDLRGQDTSGRFAWFDTVTDSFESHGGEMTWDTWAEFAACYDGDQLERYRSLTPVWAGTAEDGTRLAREASEDPRREPEAEEPPQTPHATQDREKGAPDAT